MFIARPCSRCRFICAAVAATLGGPLRPPAALGLPASVCAWGHGHRGGGKGTESALVSVVSVAVAVPDADAEPEPEPDSICRPRLLPHLLGGSLPCRAAHRVVNHVVIVVRVVTADGDRGWGFGITAAS